MPATRKNVKDLSADEKRKYLGALKTMKTQHRTLANGKPAPTPIFEEYPILHRGIMMLLLKDGSKQPIGHRNSSFLCWHRLFLKNFEDDLLAIDPTVTLIYWDWTDPASTTALLSDDFMGRPHSGPISGPLQGWTNAVDSHLLQRDPGDFQELSDHTKDVLALINRETKDFAEFSKALESFHDFVHVWAGGNMQDLGTAANDPIFYVHHANVDRMWSLYQDYGHATQFRPFFTRSAGAQESGTRIGDFLWPWDGGFAHLEADMLRNKVAHRVVGGALAATNGSALDYRNLRYSYDNRGPDLVINGTIRGTVSHLRPNLFHFLVPESDAAQTFTIETTGTVDVELELYGPALCGNCFGEKRAYDDNSGAGGLNARITLTLRSGHYWVVVRAQDPGDRTIVNAPFSVVVSSVKNVTSTTGVRGTKLIVGQIATANISAHGQTDWYNFTLEGTETKNTIVQTSGSIDTVIVLYGAAPPKGIIAWDDDSGDNLSSQVKARLGPGVYHVAVRTSTNQIGNYRISVRAA